MFMQSRLHKIFLPLADHLNLKLATGIWNGSGKQNRVMDLPTTPFSRQKYQKFSALLT